MQNENVDGELYNLGNEIKRFFISFNKETNINFHLSPRFDNIKYWVKAAELCKEYGLGSEEFIRLFYDYVKRPYSKINFPILPFHLGGAIGKAAIKYYINCLNATSSNPSDSATNTSEVKSLSTLISNNSVKAYVDDSFKFFNSIIKNSPNKESVIKLHLYSIPSWLRVLVCDDDPYILKTFGQEALYQLDGGIPNLKTIIEEKLGLNTSYNNVSIVDNLITKLKSYDFKRN